jgi:hypothetical protein
MIKRGGVALAAVVALAGTACGHPEKSVVDQYFNAVNAKDSQTLSSFAAVNFDKKVDRWVIKKTISDEKKPAPLPDLVQKSKDADAGIAANKKAYSAYGLDHFNEIEQVKDARKANKPVPAKLSDVATKWDDFTNKDRDLRKSVAVSKDAVEKEKRSMARSIGDVEDVENLKGDVNEKQIEVDLTIGGQVQPYVMTLRKYDVKRDNGQTVRGRWVIQNLQPTS